MSHTPAPWKWDGNWLSGQGDLILWYTTDDNGVHAKPENARLIAAAPQLLQALEHVAASLYYNDYGDPALLDSFDESIIDAAIRAAKGEA